MDTTDKDEPWLHLLTWILGPVFSLLLWTLVWWIVTHL